MNALRRLLKKTACLIAGHRWSSWQLYVAHYSLGITKDATRRACSCCGRRQSVIIPFKQFTITSR